jgi:hypothetical protein
MDRLNNEAGAPPLDWWKISPSGFKGAHFATYPPELCRVPIESMCPREVCTVCDEPRRRIADASAGRSSAGQNGGPFSSGWTDCGHGAYRVGRVLDIFAGSGTTLEAAQGLGRSGVGIDFDERNADIALQRVGQMALDVIHHQPSGDQP